MEVRIHTRGDTGLQELGAIVLKDGQLVPEPMVRALVELLAQSLYVYDQGIEIAITATKEPEKFLRALANNIHGSLWAGEVEE
jgi:hypothetical protein